MYKFYHYKMTKCSRTFFFLNSIVLNKIILAHACFNIRFNEVEMKDLFIHSLPSEHAYPSK